MAKQLSIYDLPEVEKGFQPGLSPGESAVAPTLEPAGSDQGSLFDASFQLDADFTEVPLPEGYRVAADEAAVAEVARELRAAGRFAFDTETDSLDPMRSQLIGLSLSTGPGNAVYIPTPHPCGRGVDLAALRRLLGPVFADPHIAKVGHNLKYDLRTLTRAGIETRGADFDTMLAAQLLEPDLECGLKELARRELGVMMTDYRSLTTRGKRRLELRQLSISAVAAYAGADAEVTFRLYERFAERIDAAELQPVFDLEMELLPIVARMEDAGVRIDVGYLRRLERVMTAEVARIAEEVYELAGARFNLNSTAQLADILYNRLGLPVLKETKTGRSTDEGVLRALSPRHPLPAKLLEYRERQKLVSTYVTALAASVNPETGRVHPHFRQLGAVSGRFSCTEPNLQNLPKDGENTIRRAFVAAPGKLLLSADYSQIELRILAHITGDPTLRRTFQEGEDVHRRTAAEIFGVAPEEVTAEQRRVAKTVVFGIAYGQSAVGLAQQLQIPVEQAKAYIDQYFARYPGVRQFTRDTVALALRQGYVTTLLGRRRLMPQLKSPEPRVRAAAVRQATNHPIQGCTSSDTRILTKEEGYVRIGELGGERITVWDGEQWARAWVAPSGKKRRVRVTFRGGSWVDASPDHRFLCINTRGSRAWKTAGEIGEQEYVQLTEAAEWHGPVLIPVVEPSRPGNANNACLTSICDLVELGEWLGRVASDGCVSGEDTCLIVAQHEEAILPRLVATTHRMTRSYHYDARLRPGRTQRLHRIDIGSKRLNTQLRQIGIKEHIPRFVWSDSDLLAAYLRGLFDGDGTVNADGPYLIFGKIHQKLAWAEEVQQALFLLGIRGRIVKSADRVTVSVMKKDAGRFAQRVGFLNPVKREKLGAILPSKNHYQTESAIYGRALRVRSVEVTDEWVEMYDVLDSDSEQFVANGVVTHNSAADIVKRAMCRLAPRLEPFDARLLLQVHDELVLEVAAEQIEAVREVVVRTMEEPPMEEFAVPLLVETKVGEAWS